MGCPDEIILRVTSDCCGVDTVTVGFRSMGSLMVLVSTTLLSDEAGTILAAGSTVLLTSGVVNTGWTIAPTVCLTSSTLSFSGVLTLEFSLDPLRLSTSLCACS